MPVIIILVLFVILAIWLTNLYNNQVKKIKAVIETLHEDLQHDYNREIEELL